MVIFCIPCLAILAYFVVASIFFPKYRTYIREGWRCFLDKLRGRHCSVSFDNRMRLALSAWLARRGMVRLGKFLYNKRNFDMTLIIVAVISTIVTIYLFAVLVQFWISPPCGPDTCSV